MPASDEPDSYGRKPVIAVSQNRSVIIPLFRVGYPELDLVATLDLFKDWRTL